MVWILCLLCFAQPLIAAQLDIQVRAPSAILMNAETGAILFEKQAYVASNPASTTKIATALYVLDNALLML